ncbi:MAG: hypothetical protein LC722_06870 [Actinobacteria bacterium]|nr:hypothetical protein [Actinomycetota bacterium]
MTIKVGDLPTLGFGVDVPSGVEPLALAGVAGVGSAARALALREVASRA